MHRLAKVKRTDDANIIGDNNEETGTHVCGKERVDGGGAGQ